MNALRSLWLLVILSGPLLGCPLESANPITAPSPEALDARLLGLWQQTGTERYFHVSTSDGSRLAIREVENGEETFWVAHSSVLGEAKYLNVRPGDSSYTYLLKYEFRDKDTLAASPLTIRAFGDALDAGHLEGRVAHYVAHTDFRFTDTSENIARFLSANGRVLFQEAEVWVFKRVREVPAIAPRPPALPVYPLHDAAWWGDVERAKRLVAEGADVNARDNSGLPPLYLAAVRGHEVIVDVLIRHGADVNVDVGTTPLYAAVREGHVAVASMLVASGAEVDVDDDRNMTPLHWAVAKNNPALVQLLLTSGADPNRRDMFGRTPLERAVTGGYDEIAELLKRHGAKE
jgi:hypothetical protein